MIRFIQMLLLTVLTSNYCFANGFLDQRYRGWLWFEDKQKVDKENEGLITSKQAREELEEFSKKLEELKFMMLARPTPENVRRYREKEKEMWDKAITLHQAWDMANFLYPEQADLINNPVNVHAVKFKRKLEAEGEEQKIREFAQNYELILFSKNSCPYCHEFAPVFENFAKGFGFNFEKVILDSLEVNPKANYLVSKLNIDAAPTIYVVSKNGKDAFELIRGYASISELKTATYLAWKYVNDKAKDFRSKVAQ